MTRVPAPSGDDDGRVLDAVAEIGEDIGRGLVTKVASFAVIFCFGAGVFEGGAPPALRVTAVVAAGVGGLIMMVATLGGWRRSRQWVVIVLNLLVCTGLTALILG